MVTSYALPEDIPSYCSPISVGGKYQQIYTNSHHYFIGDYIVRSCSHSIPSPPSRIGYTLNTLTMTNPDNSSDAEAEICSYINTQITAALPALTPLSVMQGVHLKLIPSVATIPTKDVRKPDGSIKINGYMWTRVELWLVFNNAKTSNLPFPDAGIAQKPDHHSPCTYQSPFLHFTFHGKVPNVWWKLKWRGWMRASNLTRHTVMSTFQMSQEDSRLFMC